MMKRRLIIVFIGILLLICVISSVILVSSFKDRKIITNQDHNILSVIKKIDTMEMDSYKLACKAMEFVVYESDILAKEINTDVKMLQAQAEKISEYEKNILVPDNRLRRLVAATNGFETAIAKIVTFKEKEASRDKLFKKDMVVCNSALVDLIKILEREKTRYQFRLDSVKFDLASNDKDILEYSIFFGISVISLFFLVGMIRRLSSGHEASRNRTVAELRESEQNLATTLNSIGDAVIATDKKGLITQINPVAEELTGWTRTEALGRSVAEVFVIKNAKTGRSVESPVEVVLREGLIVGLANHTVLIARDGTEYQIADSGAPIFCDENHSITGVVMVFRDVTEQYRKDEQMRLTQFCVDNSPIDVLWTTPEGQILYVNEATCLSLGYSREELLGMSIHDINPEFKKERWYETLKKIKACEFNLIETSRRKKDGSIYPVETVPFCVEHEGSEIYCVFSRDITERKKARELLEDSWKDLRRYVNNHLTYNARLAPDGTILMLNRAAVKDTGLDENDLIGKPFPDASWWNYDKKIQKKLKEWINRAAKGETIIEEVVVRKDPGVFITIIFSLNPVLNDYGDVEYLIGEGYDISKIKESEAELRKAHVLINSMSSFAGIVNPEGRLEFLNNRAIEALGFSAEEELGRLFWECDWIFKDDPKNVETVKAAVKAAIKGESVKEEVRGITADGHELPLLFNTMPISDDTGKIVGAAVEGVDISDLRRSEERFQVIFEACPDGILVMDLETWKPLFANPACCRMLGYSMGEIIKLRLKDLHPRVMIKEVAAEINAHLNGEKSLAEDVPVLRKDGITFEADIKIVVIKLNGSEIGVGFIRDISDRKQLEGHVRQLQKMEAIGALAGGIAHDFNNILSPIVGYTELIKLKASDERAVTKYADHILVSSGRARDLVRQILAFSRKSNVEKQATIVQPILKEALKLLRSSIPSTIEMRQEIDPDCGVVMANPVQIHQIIMNFCTNAFHAMRGNDGGIMEVKLTEDEFDLNGAGPEKCLKLEVKDTGKGIEPQILDRIFDPYFTTKGPGEGTGMGLAIIYGIVKEYGGHVGVKSELDTGTVFTVHLPLIEINEVKPETGIVDSMRGGRERILVVDDEEMIALLLQNMLKSLGYTVTPRTSSVEAFQLFQAKPDSFDMVITDMTMPNMTGLELVSRLKSIRDDILIIICTGFSEQITDQKIKALGINGALMKPVFLEGLAKTVRDIFDKKV